MIDGEAVFLLDNGLADFDALRSKRHDHEARLVAFDLLAIDGEDIRPQPLHARKARLAKLLGGARVGSALRCLSTPASSAWKG